MIKRAEITFLISKQLKSSDGASKHIYERITAIGTIFSNDHSIQSEADGHKNTSAVKIKIHNRKIVSSLLAIGNKYYDVTDVVEIDNIYSWLHATENDEGSFDSGAEPKHSELS